MKLPVPESVAATTVPEALRVRVGVGEREAAPLLLPLRLTVPEAEKEALEEGWPLLEGQPLAEAHREAAPLAVPLAVRQRLGVLLPVALGEGEPGPVPVEVGQKLGEGLAPPLLLPLPLGLPLPVAAAEALGLPLRHSELLGLRVAAEEAEPVRVGG